ncbi:MAG: LysE family translocator [Aestuariivirga sp.]|jgi:homoserine/homoserine lactone efflux protein|uniref:LysE family translocator n=1 Tax=Aestuariivirga sp. TaxID=2650926 RepID=UPI0038D11AC7
MAPGMLLAFAGACALLFLKPGPAMSVIVANSVGYGVRGGLVSVAGNVTGFILLLAVVGLGLSWIAATMQAWFDWIRLGGAVYLAWLGLSRLRNAGRAASYGENPTGELFRDGFVVAVANPEVLLFLAAFLPPFVDPRSPAGPQIFALAVVFVLISAIAGALLAVLAGQARQFLSGGRLKYIDYLSGGLLVVAGLWLGWPSLEMLL